MNIEGTLHGELCLIAGKATFRPLAPSERATVMIPEFLVAWATQIIAQDKIQHTAPPPGSDEAINRGCICPVLDNAHGKGYMGIAGVYTYVVGCPVHPLSEVVPEAIRKD